VEAEYRAAREPRDHTPSDLHQAWAAHEATWPLAERSATSPKSDIPDANSEVSHGCEKIHENGETVMIPALRSLEAEDSGRQLVGLEYALKGTERIKEKVARTLEEQPELMPWQALAAIPDAVRFTFCYAEDQYTTGVYADLDRLTARGFELAKPLKNSWDSDQYKGINTQWREPTTGQLFEVQFHTQASFEAKQLSHVAYERIRNPQTSDAELDELEDFQRHVCGQIPIPPGAAEVAYFPGKERDG
jgi:hypothetical protein